MGSFCDLSAYKGVIFDMDGTLVDSDQAIAKAILPWCELHDLELDKVLTAGRGMRFADFIKRFVPHLDIRNEAQNLEKTEETFAEHVIEVAGAGRFISYLCDMSLPWILATSADLDNAISRMQTCQLPIPKDMVTAQDVKKGKPDPEPFILAAKKLGLSTQACVVFEDSDAGVTGALEAGCDVVVVGEFCQLTHPRIVARITDYSQWNNMLEKEIRT
ncbi:HAD-IA family hydrolase [Pseudoalteromonas sp. SMS1]|uniref:HAD-IA family hydrolase n=1 Tax=Pseudoalteromonas sp. SMS1 TaxID=2908894 RepID=UPI001F1B06BD|nr:HAD-IA family hydrolase [Pseudoalteromonas sp. SMS1]MCF2856625.1 HAD-IA family hydrolase [Pseudoalteromonas sp. SMS1]